MNKQLDDWKKDYEKIPVPKELNNVVARALEEGKKTTHIAPTPKKQRSNWRKRLALSIATASALFIGSINISHSFAENLASVPGMAGVVQIFSMQDIQLAENNVEVSLDRPVVKGLEHTDFQDVLNEKYQQENAELYQSMSDEIEKNKENGHLSVINNVDILTDSDNVLSVCRTTTITQASAAQSVLIDNIDPQNDWLITLPSLFKNDDYIARISDYIAQEIAQSTTNEGESRVFFTEDDASFKKIAPSQTFSITNEGKLVIYFDEYSIAPGSMGIVTFTIPTKVIEDLLISDHYIH